MTKHPALAKLYLMKVSVLCQLHLTKAVKFVLFLQVTTLTWHSIGHLPMMMMIWDNPKYKKWKVVALLNRARAKPRHLLIMYADMEE